MCTCHQDVGLKTYMQVPDSKNSSASVLLRYDPVLQLLENTLKSPVNVDTTLELDRSVIECPSVQRTYLNAVRARWPFFLSSIHSFCRWSEQCMFCCRDAHVHYYLYACQFCNQSLPPPLLLTPGELR